MAVLELPERLERPPLVEAICELRFKSDKEAVGDLLPGILYAKLKRHFPESTSLPMSSIPRELREQPEFRHRPHIRLGGRDRALLLGDHVVAISKVPPYSGWADFRALCLEVFAALEDTGLIEETERVSLKCVNFIQQDGAAPFALLNGELRLGSHAVVLDRGLRVRAEIDLPPYVSIVELTGGATIRQDGQDATGFILAIDTLHTSPPVDFWRTASSHIDGAHAMLKQLFFDLLGPGLVKKYGPVGTAA